MSRAVNPFVLSFLDRIIARLMLEQRDRHRRVFLSCSGGSDYGETSTHLIEQRRNRSSALVEGMLIRRSVSREGRGYEACDEILPVTKGV